jgi:hypothetical protein
MHSVDCIKGNTKPGVKFWGVIADTYNSTTDAHRQRTPKNLKDQWSTYNKLVSLFNQIYNQECSCRQSRVDDAMVLDIAKERYKNQIGGSGFKRFHWWEAVRHQPKWRAKLAGSSTTDPWVSLSDRTGEEAVTRPIGHDRAKAAVRKGKVKEGSSSQSESSIVMGGMMSILKRLDTSFAKARLWKQWNKLKECSTTNMDEEELKIHCEVFHLIQRDLQFAQGNEAAVEDGDDE